MSRGPGRRRRGWQARAPRGPPVVKRGEVGHADGEVVRHFEGLPETRAVRCVTARLGANVEFGGEREGARGAGLAARGTG